MPHKDPEARKKSVRESNRRWRANHPRSQNEATQDWRRRHPEMAAAQNRRNRIKRQYGLSVEEYEEILAQGCAICGRSAPEVVMHLDHDHSNGCVREGLCNGCNTGIGSLGEDPERLWAAIKYLLRHRE